MRKIIVAGNWKMNKKFNEAIELVEEINQKVSKSSNLESVLLFPPYPYLTELGKHISKDFLHLGSQNISFEKSGAFTGEVSAEMLESIGIQYTLIGHSERRKYFNEKGDELKKKVEISISQGVNPIYCCGESLEERNNQTHFQVVGKQISEVLFHLESKDLEKIIVAYEPVWAIGTGETASSAQAEEMHAFIRGLIGEKFGNRVAQGLSILYGGSCNASNAHELFACENVDGGLIGGASLKAEDFLAIIDAANGKL